jgi:predicted HAD superfamily Cof-like phosphohydrolase
MEEMRMQITIADFDYSGFTPLQQLKKIQEELRELKLELVNLGFQPNERRLNKVAAEAFDLIQATYGMLIVLGVDIEAANRRHIEKLEARHE